MQQVPDHVLSGAFQFLAINLRILKSAADGYFQNLSFQLFQHAIAGNPLRMDRDLCHQGQRLIHPTEPRVRSVTLPTTT